MAFPAKGHCFMEEPRADILNSTPGPPVPMETAEEFVMDVQVEVQFTIQHTLDELKDAFVRRAISRLAGHPDTDTSPAFFETGSFR